MTTIPRRRIERTYDSTATRTLRFVDGLVVDPSDCPRNIHARSHWLAPGLCHCAEEGAVAPAPPQQPDRSSTLA